MTNKILLLLMSMLLLVSCSDGKKVKLDTLTVSVSVLPQKFFVEKIAGDKVKINTLIPPGASPAAYEPTPKQIADLVNSQIYVKVGHPSFPFEKKWFDRLIANKDIIAVDMSEGTTFRSMEEHDHESEEEEEEGEHHQHHEEDHSELTKISNDPHIWVSPASVKIATENILKALIKADPANKEYYTQNYNKFKAEIEQLQQEIKTTLTGLKKGTKFMVFHPSWGYFADEFGLEQIAVEADGKEPTAKGIAHVVDQAKKEQIKVIFVQTGFNTSAAQVIAREIGGKVIEINPLAENWLDNLRLVAKTFKETMGE